ncbi:MAG TPA: hypothetical protein PKX00_12740 [Opitutaceae bacterium]|nr:hypothetical protein [Opitutaceae bacterium]
MAPRLLSLLSKIETALTEQGASIVARPMQRSVSYHKGLARLAFADGGAIALQSFSLADGQICVKAALSWAGREGQVIHAIYPHSETHDWVASAEGVALAWMSGPASALPLPQSNAVSASLDRLASVG